MILRKIIILLLLSTGITVCAAKKSQKISPVPFAEKSTTEWNIADSTVWAQAIKFEGFKLVSNWKDLKQAPASKQTKVAVTQDEKNLYVRFEALNALAKDRVELVLGTTRHAPKYLFALSRAGKKYGMKNNSTQQILSWEGKVKDGESSYIAMFKVPLSTIKELKAKDNEFKLICKFARLASDAEGREESTLSGVSITMTHSLAYWVIISIKKGK